MSLPLGTFDGLWCSFAAAYFTDFRKTFSSWLKFLKKDAWVCIIDIDDLLGHEPLSENTRKGVQDFYEDALSGGRYDFRAGRKVQSILEENGFRVTRIDLTDKELSFDGPASVEVSQAWKNRFNRMGGLKSFLGEEFTPFVEEFTQGISSVNHHSRCKVVCCIGTTVVSP